MLNVADLPDDITALKAMLVVSEARNLRKDERIERLEKLVAAFRQALFGRKSEKADPDQFELALEDLETAITEVYAEEDMPATTGCSPPAVSVPVSSWPIAGPMPDASWSRSPAPARRRSPERGYRRTLSHRGGDPRA